MNQDELFLFNYLKEEIQAYSSILPSNYENQKYFNDIYQEKLSLEDNITRVWSFIKSNFSKNTGSTLLRLPFKEKGITLNIEQVDLLNIIGSRNIIELKNTLKTIENVKINVSNFNIDYKKMSPNDFDRIKRQCFKAYKTSLVNENIKKTKDGKNKLNNKIVDYISTKAHFSNNEQSALTEIINFVDDLDSVPILLNKKFGKKKTTLILKLLKSYNLVAEKGILESSYDDFINLYQLLHNFNTVIFHKEFSYNKVVNADNTLYFDGINKCLEFAKRHNLLVKIEPLIEYKNFTANLYGTKKSVIFERLELYINSLTKYLEKYNRDNGLTITTITLFDELLENEIPFRMRNLCENTSDKGWFNKLEFNQLLNLASIVKANMNNIKCLYSEINLLDKNKRGALFKLLNNINSIKPHLIDGIGYKVYIDESINYQVFEETIKDLSLIGYSLYIEDFDLSLSNSFVNNHTLEESLTLKEEIYSNIENILKNYMNNIVGFSILNLNSNSNDLLEEHSLGGFFSTHFTELSKAFFDSSKCHYNYYVTFNNNLEESKLLIEKAVNKGYKYLGFVCHANIDKYTKGKDLLNYDEVSNFSKTIKSLKNQYSDIKIYSGLIVDYKEENISTLIEYKKKVDYLILETNNNIVNALNSGLFNIVSNINLKDLSKRELEGICKCSNKFNIPIGIDINTVIDNKEFYEVIKNTRCQIIFENSFKTPILFEKNDELLNNIKNELQLNTTNIVSNNYDIVSVIKKNKEIDKALNNTKEKAKSDEYYIINKILNGNGIQNLIQEINTSTNNDYRNLLLYTRSLDVEATNKTNILEEIEKKYNPKQIVRRKKMGYTYTFYVVLITGVLIAVACGIAFVLILK